MERALFQIGGYTIGGGTRPYVIAELGINHGGDADLAHRMLEAAAGCGVDAVKLQTFETARFVSRRSRYFDVLATVELPAEALEGLVDHAARLGVTLFSAVFDEPSVDLWVRLGAPAFKVASGDITHLPLLHHIAAQGKPMIVSTGGSTVIEVARAVGEITEAAPVPPVALLHCVSHYPTKAQETNLACIATMRAAFGVPVGFSDHTLGTAVPVAAAALGAEIIEKHFTLDRDLPGPDHALSATPDDMKRLVEDVRSAHAAVGSPRKAPVEASDHVQQIRRSLAADVDLPAGTVIEAAALAVKRPGTGIPPADMARVVGMATAHDISQDDILSWDDLSRP